MRKNQNHTDEDVNKDQHPVKFENSDIRIIVAMILAYIVILCIFMFVYGLKSAPNNCIEINDKDVKFHCQQHGFDNGSYQKEKERIVCKQVNEDNTTEYFYQDADQFRKQLEQNKCLTGITNDD